MNNIIFGSGIIGLLARHILGSTWTIIPFKKSRYYSYDVPIADNDITYTEVSHDVIKQICVGDISTYFPIAMSYRGFLTFNKNLLVNALVDKIYGDNIHPMAAHMLSHDCTAHSTTTKHLFDILLTRVSSVP